MRNVAKVSRVCVGATLSHPKIREETWRNCWYIQLALAFTSAILSIKSTAAAAMQHPTTKLLICVCKIKCNWPDGARRVGRRSDGQRRDSQSRRQSLRECGHPPNSYRVQAEHAEYLKEKRKKKNLNFNPIPVGYLVSSFLVSNRRFIAALSRSTACLSVYTIQQFVKKRKTTTLLLKGFFSVFKRYDAMAMSMQCVCLFLFSTSRERETKTLERAQGVVVPCHATTTTATTANWIHRSAVASYSQDERRDPRVWRLPAINTSHSGATGCYLRPTFYLCWWLKQKKSFVFGRPFSRSLVIWQLATFSSLASRIDSV